MEIPKDVEYFEILGTRTHLAPLGLHMHAEDFLKLCIGAPAVEGYSPARFATVCHAIESALKAFLCMKGVPFRKLRKHPYGHNLQNILEEAEEQGLNTLVALSDEMCSAIRSASSYHQNRVYAYPNIWEAAHGYRGSGDFEKLRMAAQLLVDELRQPTLDHA